MIKKYKFTYRLFYKEKTFKIEAFSQESATQILYANFPRAKIISVEETTTPKRKNREEFSK